MNVNYSSSQNDDTEKRIGKFRIYWDTTIIDMKASAAREKDEISQQLKLKQLEMDTLKNIQDTKNTGERSKNEGEERSKSATHRPKERAHEAPWIKRMADRQTVINTTKLNTVELIKEESSLF